MNKKLPKNRKDLISIFESQIASRHMDLKARLLKDQGKCYYTIGSSGHEGNAVFGYVFPYTDMAFLHYRSTPFFLQRSKQVSGLTPFFDTALSFMASSEDPISGGRHKVIGSKKLNIPPQTSTIASHLPKAVGTAFSITILTATASVLTHRKYNSVDFNIIKNYGTFVIIGVFSGTLMAALMNTKTLLFFFSAVVYFFGAYLLLQSEKKKKIKKKFNIFPRIIFGFLSGLISAPMGITGAMMNVPILRYFGYPINLAIGSSAAIGFIIALFGSIGFFTSGLMLKADIPLSIGFINIPAFIIFVPITTFMARIGAKTVQDLDRVKTQRLFGVFLYVIGTLFLYRFLVT